MAATRPFVYSGVRPPNAGRHRHLLVNPAVGLLHAVPQADGRRPAELLINKCIVAAAAANAFGRVHLVAPLDPDPSDVLHHVDQLINRDQLVAADVDWLADVAGHQRARAVHTIVDIGEAPRLLAVPPHLNLWAAGE